MQHFSFRISAFVKQFFKGFRGRRGYGIHSPFAFDFVKQTLYPDSGFTYYIYKAIEKKRQELRNDTRSLKITNNKSTSVKRIARTSASPSGNAQMIHRIAVSLQSKRILELGTSLGITTAYLASISKESKVISIDHDANSQAIAKEVFRELNIDNVELVNGEFSKVLPAVLNNIKYIDLAFIDGNHTKEGTLAHFDFIKKHARPSSVIIFHDIHWSKEMHDSWKEIITHDSITVSFETYNMGIVFFDPDLNKRHYFA